MRATGRSADDVRGSVRPTRVPVDHGVRRAVPVAGAARDHRLRRVHAGSGGRPAQPSAAVRRVRHVRPVGHAGQGRDGRPRVVRPAPHRVPAAPGPGRGPARLVHGRPGAEDPAEARHGEQRRPRGPRPDAVLPAAVTADRPLHADGRTRHVLGRSEPQRPVQRERPVRRDAVRAGDRRRSVCVRQH